MVERQRNENLPSGRFKAISSFTGGRWIVTNPPYQCKSFKYWEFLFASSRTLWALERERRSAVRQIMLRSDTIGVVAKLVAAPGKLDFCPFA